jgi:D-alanyl-D-alanine carboxypeptidase/D-alanyl-D-alanine-endopeptidase (penicillin-binding protein 4)
VGSNWIVLELDDGPPPRLTPRPETSYVRLDYDIRIEDSDRPGRPPMTFREMSWGDEYTIRGTVTRWDKRYEYLRLGVSRPGLYAATLLEEALARRGIEVAGRLREGRAPPEARTLATIRTAPLAASIRVLNQESNNVVAELVTQDLGAAFHSLPGTGEKGLQVIRDYLVRELGFPADGFRLADASGLSVDNRFSAAQFTRALSHFHVVLGAAFVETLAPQGHHPHASAVVPPPEMRMYVKSGTLPSTGVNTLVGYVFLDRTGEAFSFALLARRRGGGPDVFSGTLTNPLLSVLVETLK